MTLSIPALVSQAAPLRSRAPSEGIFVFSAFLFAFFGLKRAAPEPQAFTPCNTPVAGQLVTHAYRMRDGQWIRCSHNDIHGHRHRHQWRYGSHHNRFTDDPIRSLPWQHPF